MIKIDQIEDLFEDDQSLTGIGIEIDTEVMIKFPLDEYMRLVKYLIKGKFDNNDFILHKSGDILILDITQDEPKYSLLKCRISYSDRRKCIIIKYKDYILDIDQYVSIPCSIITDQYLTITNSNIMYIDNPIITRSAFVMNECNYIITVNDIDHMVSEDYIYYLKDLYVSRVLLKTSPKIDTLIPAMLLTDEDNEYDQDTLLDSYGINLTSLYGSVIFNNDGEVYVIYMIDDTFEVTYHIINLTEEVKRLVEEDKNNERNIIS